MDVHDPSTRSRNMAAIRSRDTKPELIIRKALFKRGYRYRLNDKYLPGKPDIVLKKYQAVIFVHGCFWHRHDCHLFKWPKTRIEFWHTKLNSNRNRDKFVVNELLQDNWRVLSVWECAIKGKNKLKNELLIEDISSWIKSDSIIHEITGTNDSDYISLKNA